MENFLLNLNFLQKFVSYFLIIAVNLNRADAVDYYVEKPSFLPSCRIKEPEFTKCSTNSIQKLIDQLIVGIPEITESFGPFDPMHVKNIYFKQDGSEIANLHANLSSVVVKGFSKTVIKESKVNKNDFSWNTKIFLPKMRMDAHYDMNGRMLLIPLRGSGEIFIEIENLNIILRAQPILYEKGGFTFNNISRVNVDLSMTRVRTYLTNLFNGRSKEIERSTNQFFNDHWRDFYEALKPIIAQTVENILFDVLYKVFSLIPANFFIEDIPTSDQLYGGNQTTHKAQVH